MHKALKKRSMQMDNYKRNPAYPKFKKGGKSNLPQTSECSEEHKEMLDMGKE